MRISQYLLKAAGGNAWYSSNEVKPGLDFIFLTGYILWNSVNPPYWLGEIENTNGMNFPLKSSELSINKSEPFLDLSTNIGGLNHPSV